MQSKVTPGQLGTQVHFDISSGINGHLSIPGPREATL